MKEIVIAGACRTAIGAYGGALKTLDGAALAGITMQAVVSRTGIDPRCIDDIRYGCCLEHHDALNTARVAALMAGIPETVTAVTLNRVCISGMEAVLSSMALIQAGMADIVLAGGVEHMSGVAYTVPSARWGARLQDQVFVDALIHALHCGSYLSPLTADAPINTDREPAASFVGKPYHMAHTAEFLAEKMDIGRLEMDQVALRSHNNAERSTLEGDFCEEIVPVAIDRSKKKPLVFDRDEHFRPGLTLDHLQQLPPVFIPGTGTVTAGNACGINDGAAGMLVLSADKARELGIKPLARIKAFGRGACHPAVMGLSPVPAVRDLQKRSGLKIDDFDLIELNEAFAAQYIACERALGLKRDITNVNGSGIGLGHPVGATGCRILVTLIYALKKRRKALGLATLCGGGGVSLACAVELV